MRTKSLILVIILSIVLNLGTFVKISNAINNPKILEIIKSLCSSAAEYYYKVGYFDNILGDEKYTSVKDLLLKKPKDQAELLEKDLFISAYNNGYNLADIFPNLTDEELKANVKQYYNLCLEELVNIFMLY